MKDRLDSFVEEVKARRLKVDSIIISHGIRKPELWDYYFTENKKRDARSLSKVVSGLSIGIAVEKGLMHPEDFLMDYFPHVRITNKRNEEHLSRAKIKHLLSMSLGHEMPLLMQRDYKALPENTDYISYILNSPITHTPGTFFVYTNAVTYLLSAIMQQITDVTFDKWTQDNLLTPIGIEELYWEHSHQGICMGSTGLHLDVRDAHEIGMLLLNQGAWIDELSAASTQIVDAGWISEMKKSHIHNQDWEKFHNPLNTCLKKIAYGYHLWVCGNGSEKYPETHFFGDGANGQQLIVIPQEEMVIAIMARLNDSRKLEEIICTKLLAFLRK